MDDKDFLNDPIFKNLRKFAEKEVVNVRLDEDIREAFRSASPKVSKAKIFRRSIYSVIGITIALPTLSYAHVLPKPIAKVVEKATHVVIVDPIRAITSDAPKITPLPTPTSTTSIPLSPSPQPTFTSPATPSSKPTIAGSHEGNEHSEGNHQESGEHSSGKHQEEYQAKGTLQENGEHSEKPSISGSTDSHSESEHKSDSGSNQESHSESQESHGSEEE